MTFDTTLAYRALHPHFRQRLTRDESLALHSSFGVGGKADLWVDLQTKQELNSLISLCARERWPLLVVGAGSNTLYADEGVRGIVARIAFQQYHLQREPGEAEETALVIADAGVRWSQLLQELVPQGWGGLEFGVGIPGTLGAGIISNAGAHNQELGQALEWVEVLDARNCNTDRQEPLFFPVIVESRYPREGLDLGHRHSRFRDQRLTHIDAQGQLIFPKRGLIEPAELVVKLALRVQRRDPQVLKTLIDEYEQARTSADPSQKHLGSIFKDPPGLTARVLLEKAGLSGRTAGNAQISQQHPNYIVNCGGARAADILALILEAHQRVLSTSGVHLALNVELLGAWQHAVEPLTIS